MYRLHINLKCFAVKNTIAFSAAATVMTEKKFYGLGPRLLSTLNFSLKFSSTFERSVVTM
jgi:hypothetical protein